MITTKIILSNLTCDACVKLSKMKIAKIDGVNEVKISDIGGKTEIYSTRNISIGEIEKALEGTNYKVSKI